MRYHTFTYIRYMMKVKLFILVTIPKCVLCIWFVPQNIRNPGPFGNSSLSDVLYPTAEKLCHISIPRAAINLIVRSKKIIRINQSIKIKLALQTPQCVFFFNIWYPLRIWIFESSMRIGAGTAMEFARIEDDVCINYSTVKLKL